MLEISVFAIHCFAFSSGFSDEQWRDNILDQRDKQNNYLPNSINLRNERKYPQEKGLDQSINIADEQNYPQRAWRSMQPLKGDESLRWHRQLIKNYQPFSMIQDKQTFEIVKRKRKERYEIGRGYRHGENWASYEKRVGNEHWRSYNPKGLKHIICGNRNCSVMPTIGDGYCFYRGIVNSLNHEGYTGVYTGGRVPVFYDLLNANLAQTVSSLEALRHWAERTYTDADWNIDKYIYDADKVILPQVLAKWLRRVVPRLRSRVFHWVANLRLTDKAYMYLFALHYYYEYQMWMSMAARNMRRRVPVPGFGLFRVATYVHADEYAREHKLCLYFKLPNHYEGLDCRKQSMNYVDDARILTGKPVNMHFLDM